MGSATSLKYRLALLFCIIVIVPTGYLIRFAETGGWISDFLGSVAYEMFWIALVALLCPKLSPLWIAIGVFFVTCGLEFLQLWQPAWLQAVRATLPGRLVLGNTFVWTDFLSYGVGSGLGGWVGRAIAQRWR
jgi:hypothetical protein